MLLKYSLLGLITAAFLFAFWPILQKLLFRWEGGDSNYCYLIVPLFVYLLWDIRHKGSRFKVQGSGFFNSISKESSVNQEYTAEELFADSKKQTMVKENEGDGGERGFKFSEFSLNTIGFIPIVASIFLITVGELGSVETLLYIGLWGCVVGVVFLLYGWRMRKLSFPLIILAFIVPLPAYINRILTFQLKLAASTIATIMLRFSGVSVFQDGNIIDLGITQLQVVEACSGLRYLMPLFLLALLIGYFFTKGWWRNGIIVITGCSAVGFFQCPADMDVRATNGEGAPGTGGKFFS